ncbi:MAG: hypothetical protein COB93_09555 [Sneathiella sp.]|nr:MAG: hypothetical protein COB93_09555 [Sneathiella sp.]
MSDIDTFALPDEETKQKLDKAAEIITNYMNKALRDCLEAGLEREHFTAGVIATMMQAVETSLGGNSAGALQEMAQMAANHEDETPIQ